MGMTRPNDSPTLLLGFRPFTYGPKRLLAMLAAAQSAERRKRRLFYGGQWRTVGKERKKNGVV
jgi:hypothetical protein